MKNKDLLKKGDMVAYENQGSYVEGFIMGVSHRTAGGTADKYAIRLTDGKMVAIEAMRLQRVGNVKILVSTKEGRTDELTIKLSEFISLLTGAELFNHNELKKVKELKIDVMSDTAYEELDKAKESLEFRKSQLNLINKIYKVWRY